jgi:hypothetical protein
VTQNYLLHTLVGDIVQQRTFRFIGSAGLRLGEGRLRACLAERREVALAGIGLKQRWKSGCHVKEYSYSKASRRITKRQNLPAHPYLLLSLIFPTNEGAISTMASSRLLPPIFYKSSAFYI